MILSSFWFLCSRLEHFLNREVCIINGLPLPTNIQLITITGEFTCRVDFRQSPTKYHRVRLTVIGRLTISLFSLDNFLN